jgi:hypothetical protein
MDDDRMAALEQMVTALSEEVLALRTEMDTMTGGISGAIDKRKRGAFRGEFEGKYPDIAKYKPALEKLKMPEVMDKASDAIYDYQNSPDYNEDGESSMTAEIVAELESKLGEVMALLGTVKESLPQEPTPATPEALPPADEMNPSGDDLPEPVREAARSLRGKPL